MNHRTRQFLAVVTAVFAVSGAATLAGQGGQSQPKVAVVVAGQAAEQVIPVGLCVRESTAPP
ncbi:MAG: hypothetical protein QOE86_4495, partial [Solirubrobacteraceae bacterium]|nr:hypothetical protein [Solirubrobacteraceae bacterium]